MHLRNSFNERLDTTGLAGKYVSCFEFHGASLWNLCIYSSYASKFLRPGELKPHISLADALAPQHLCESRTPSNFFVQAGVKSWWYETDYLLEFHGPLHSRNSMADQGFIAKQRSSHFFQLPSFKLAV